MAFRHLLFSRCLKDGWAVRHVVVVGGIETAMGNFGVRLRDFALPGLGQG